MTLCFVTNNAHKLSEVNHLLNPSYQMVTLREIGCYEPIPEDEDSIAANSFFKATYVHEKFGIDCFADDTGLEVYSLGGRPGVHSARYAGESKNSTHNIRKLLEEMKNLTNRKARFITVITLCIGNRSWQFEGIVEGIITPTLRGSSGFGYDPVFLPDGHTKTFAEMDIHEKNMISHRGIATRKLVEFLNHESLF